MTAGRAIAEYALLGDGHGAALVSRDGSVEWWCPPRFDAPSVFARLLDQGGGHFSIRPAAFEDIERDYLPGTMVLRTTFVTAAGRVQVTDALVLAARRGHDLGRGSPHALARLVEALEGDTDVEVEYVPRPEYALVAPRLTAGPAGIETVGGSGTLLLSSERPLEIHGDRATGTLALRAGESAAFLVQHRPGLGPSDGGAPIDARAALRTTEATWRSWSDLHQGYQGAYREEVMRSALVLQALTYQPSGAVVAAPTTSLPEKPGSDWNWDYRFSWLRDASLTLKALWVGACPDESERFFGWMARAAGSPGADGRVQIMFGVEGERDLTEHELDHLAGWRDSRPVRVGNDAWRQRQLDVMGEVLEGAWVLRDQLGEPDELTAGFLRDLADRAAERWQQEDAGIWEGREGGRQYLTSKLLCWVAVDRALRLCDRLGAADRVEAWSAARDEIRRTILKEGWNEERGAYTGAFGSTHLDASVLLMPILGFVPADDERMARTIDAVEDELSSDGLVRRWTDADDGAFVTCSFWLASCRALGGDVGRAREIFDATLRHANDVGLLSEEIDPSTGELIGNFPQGLSHIGLINAAWTIEQAERSAGAATAPDPG